MLLKFGKPNKRVSCGPPRSRHEVLNELIPEVLLSTLNPCVNT
jgi:hypothetical protein